LPEIGRRPHMYPAQTGAGFAFAQTAGKIEAMK
jgi:hypothetical protein